MWPKWLADTLDRSAHDARAPGDARPHAHDVDEARARLDALPEAIDWDEASGFDLHAGYGAERTDT